MSKHTSRRAMLLSLALAATAAAFGQTFTAHVQGQKAGEGRVVIHQEEHVRRLVDDTVTLPAPHEPVKAERKAPAPRQEGEPARTQPKHEQQRGEQPSQRPHADEPSGEHAQPSAEAMAHKRYRNRYKSTGYRLQIYSGGNSRASRTEAERMAAESKAAFPELPVYTHFYPPRWVCRVGDFKTAAEAHRYLNLYRKQRKFREATVIKTQILVAY